MPPYMLHLGCLAAFSTSFVLGLLLFPASGERPYPNIVASHVALMASVAADAEPISARPPAEPRQTVALAAELLSPEPTAPAAFLERRSAPSASEQPVERTGLEVQDEHGQVPVPRRKPARREAAAKRPRSEALGAVRRFGEHLRDIPLSSFAADGTRRSMVIRPRSIQDIYYYSSRR